MAVLSQPVVAGPDTEPATAAQHAPDLVERPPQTAAVVAHSLPAANLLEAKFQVAPPPPPAPTSMVVQVVPPPERATLVPMPCGAPCAPVPAQTFQTPEVTGAAKSDDDAVVCTELTNAQVAAQMNAFLEKLQKGRTYVGVSAFLIFALRYSLRVSAWYGTNREDLLSKYAPWASDASCKFQNALCEAVCCKYHGGLEAACLD